MDKVLVTRRIPRAGPDLLRGLAEVMVSPHDRVLTPAELLAMSAGCRGLLTQLGDRIDRRFLAARPEVRMVANYAVGFDNVDLDAARELGVMVSNTPEVLTEATADLTLALMLDIMRRVSEGDRLLRSGGYKGWAPEFMLGTSLQDKILGIYGLGRVGLAVGQRARCFGMRIIYHTRRPHPQAQQDLGAEHVDFPSLLERSDVISVNAPLNRETQGAFNYDAFRRMKRGAYLVNTGRGPIVKEADLARALAEGLIRGAALDVFENEPQVEPALLKLPNVVLCPHLGSATSEVREQMALRAAGNLAAFLRGQEPPDRVA
ncbi:MAG: D-glycerate dehydrogenase [Desulfarculus sp.]|nr:MAG: D-glycerate dehydrogenase [Desulfarculus sp.]